jgi:CBS domain-containing protein
MYLTYRERLFIRKKNMATVEKLLQGKSADVWNIGPDATVYDAILKMDEKEIGALAVMLSGELIGIISERDYARKIILKDRSSKLTKVREIMTTRVFHTFPEQKIEECMAVMTTHRIRHLPVISNNTLVGMISLGDVVKEIISEQQFKIEALEHTITWGESY